MVTIDMIKQKRIELEELQKQERLKEEYKKLNSEIKTIKQKDSKIFIIKNNTNKIFKKIKEMIPK